MQIQLLPTSCRPEISMPSVPVLQLGGN
jgi:hypothetical protein